MKNLLYPFLVLYFAVTITYILVYFLNLKFNWWTTTRRIIKFDNPTAKEFKDVSNRLYLNNLIIALLAFLVVVVVIVLVWILFTMKSYKLAIEKNRFPTLASVVVGRISSYFGYRHHPVYKQDMMHYGLDFRAPIGDKVRATGDGVVIANDYAPGAGNFITVSHGYFGGKHIMTKYFHLGRHNFVKEGQLVVKGQKIGEVGDTGTTDGPHAHYEVLVDGVSWNPIRFVAVYNKKHEELFTAFVEAKPAKQLTTLLAMR